MAPIAEICELGEGCGEPRRKGGYHSTVKKQLASLLLCALLLPRAFADGLPDLGDVGSAELSPQAERRIGEQAMGEIRWREAAYLDDVEVEGYLNSLGQRLVAAAPASGVDFSFFAVSDPTLNAFALPGGFIGVHTGLVLAASTESELASVLGHEIAHVTQRHIARMIGNQGRTGMVMLASMIVAILAAGSSPDAAEAAIATGQATAMQSQLAYTRDFEREADRNGLMTLQAAGFDVRGMPAFFERLQRNSRLYENNAPAYLRTHPLTTDRITDMENRVQGLGYRQVPDSLEFRLVQAKLLALQGSAAEAVRGLEARVNGKPDDPVLRYGLTRALLRMGQLEQARASMTLLARNPPASAMVEALEAELLAAGGDHAAAAAHYRDAMKRFPLSRPLAYGLADELIAAGRPAEAADMLRKDIVSAPDDHRRWGLLAKAELARGSRAGRHRAQAEVYRLQGSLPAAVEQLELAQRAGDADFYTMSAIDARLRELRTRLRQEREAR